MFKLFSSLGCAFVVAIFLAATPAWAGEAASGGDGHGETAAEDPNKPQYVKISPLILPLIGDNGVEQVVSLVIVLEVNTRDIATEVIGMSPKLNDAFITDLYGAIDRRDRMRNGLLDVAYIKERLNKLTQQIMGPDKVKGILVQGITQRPA
ncbi:MAG TPA: hypothetical protein PKW15_06855 [Alphaproteobacteria bacterium]|nr:hypothetical protein [Alphaproteobacteria bacterium]